MVKYSIVLVLVFCTLFSFGKAISLKIENKNDHEIELWYGFAHMDDNYLSDEELVQQKEKIGLTKHKKPIRARKKAAINNYEIKKGKLLVVFGIHNNGGRTEVFRYYSSKIKGDKIEIVFESVPVYRFSKSYLKVAKNLKKLNFLGAHNVLGDIKLIGAFYASSLLEDGSSTYSVLIPSKEVDLEINKESTDTIQGVFSSTSRIPLIDKEGNIYGKEPEEEGISVEETVFPFSKSIANKFGDHKFLFLKWVLYNGANYVAKPAESKYYELLESSNIHELEKLQKLFYNEWYNDGFTNMQLFFVKDAKMYKQINLETIDIIPIKEEELLEANNLMTPGKNYRLGSKTEILDSMKNVVLDVRLVDATVMFYYITAKDYYFDGSYESAEILVLIYEYLAQRISLPELSEEIVNVDEPSTTISSIKNILADPINIESLNTYISKSEEIESDVDVINEMVDSLKTKKEKE